MRLFVFGLFLVTNSVAAAAPVVRIGTSQYDLKDVLGASQEELAEEFDAEVKNLTLDQLREATWQLLTVKDYLKLDKNSGREDFTKALRKAHLHGLIEQAVLRLLAIKVTDHILDLHGTTLEDYYDTQVLKDALLRYVKYRDFIIAHRRDPPEKDDDLYRIAKKAFRLNDQKMKVWSAMRDRARSSPQFRNRTLEIWRYLSMSGEGVKVLLLPQLVEETCCRGIYNAMARDHVDFMRSSVLEIEIRNYAGAKQALAEFVAQVIGKDEDVAVAGVLELERWLKDFSPSAKMKLSNGLGITWLTGYDFPEPGRLYESGVNSFKVLARKRPQPRASESEAKNYAYLIAASRFVPEVQCFLKDVEVKPEQLLQMAMLPRHIETYLALKVDKFEKTPYPEHYFREYVEHRGRLAETVVTATRLHIEGDVKTATIFIAKVRQTAAKVETPGLSQVYTRIADRLEKGLGTRPTKK